MEHAPGALELLVEPPDELVGVRLRHSQNLGYLVGAHESVFLHHVSPFCGRLGRVSDTRPVCGAVLLDSIYSVDLFTHEGSSGDGP